MSDNVTLPGTGTNVAADEVNDAGLGGLVKAQFVKIMDGTLDGTTKAHVSSNGLEVDVKALPTLPAGSNAIGTVSITSTVPGTGATNLGKAEDAVHSSGDTGVMALAVRQDTAASLVSASGDYAPLQVDANGYLKVNVITGGGSGGQQYAEDAAHVSGDLGTMAIGVRKDTAAALAGSDGDYQPMIFDANGRLHVIPTARVKTTDTITSALDTSALMNGTTALTPKFAVISASASGNTTVVNAVSAKKIRVVSLAVIVATANVVKFASNAVDLTGAMSFGDNGGIALPFSPFGYFESSSGNSLVINLGSAVSTTGFLTYVEV